MSLDPAVPQGYLPPPSAYEQHIEFTIDNDPLVSHPANGLGGWFAKWGGVLGRNPGPLFVIGAVTVFAPTLAGDLVTRFLLGVPAAPVLVTLTGVLSFVLQVIGAIAMVHAATRRAAGLSAGAGPALRYGVRRSLGLIGRLLVIGLVASLSIGLAACLSGLVDPFLMVIVALPLIIYSSMVIGLLIPAYVFEREPVRRAFVLLHDAFRRTAGRLVLAGMVLAGAGGIRAGLVRGAGLVTDPALARAALIAVTVVGAAVSAAAAVVALAGALVTYAERRGAEGTLTHDLVGELADNAPVAQP